MSYPHQFFPTLPAPARNDAATMMQAPAGTPAILTNGVPAGHALRLTRAQIDLQREIGQMDGFPDVQEVLRRQFARSVEGFNRHA